MLFRKKEKDEMDKEFDAEEDGDMPTWANRLFDQLDNIANDIQDMGKRIGALEKAQVTAAEESKGPRKELEAVKDQLHSSQMFLQNLVMELIKTPRTAMPIPAAVAGAHINGSAKMSVKEYIAAKNASNEAPKLP